jgi:hypothetical protein
MMFMWLVPPGLVGLLVTAKLMAIPRRMKALQRRPPDRRQVSSERMTPRYFLHVAESANT